MLYLLFGIYILICSSLVIFAILIEKGVYFND